MAGFLSAYSGTRKVHIPHPDRDYWVVLKETLSVGAKEDAERALTNGRISTEGVEMTMDTVSYAQMMVLSSIVEWNLDNEDGTIWPITLESVKRLPDLEFSRLRKMIDEMNSPDKPEERRRFPDGVVGIDTDADGRTTIVGHVLDGAGTVEASRPA